MKKIQILPFFCNETPNEQESKDILALEREFIILRGKLLQMENNILEKIPTFINESLVKTNIMNIWTPSFKKENKILKGIELVKLGLGFKKGKK